MRTAVMLHDNTQQLRGREPKYVAMWYAASKYDQHDLLTIYRKKKKQLFMDLT